MAFAILIFLYLLQSCNLASSESFIGVNYGQVADNLPSPSATAKLLQSTAVQKVRLYGADPAIIRALANTGIGIVIGAANGEIPALASDPNFATQWINSNVLAYYPASKIILITVGNEVLLTNDQNLISQLLPAMQNMQRALSSASLGGKVKVSTVHSMAILSRSDPPSSGLFNPAYQDTMRRLLQFQKDNGSPLAVNPYPFFAYQSDARPETLAFCLFQPNPGRVDSGNGIKYMNMFDAQVDAVRSALNAMGFIDVEIVVAETGWPYKGDNNEVGPGIENARAYNGNLVAHLRSMVGTPLMPGKSVDTYIFALYDEDLKSGPASERSFGLLKHQVLNEMKENNVSPDNFSYRLCMNSYGARGDLEGMEKMLNEMEHQPDIVVDWNSYAVAASSYIKGGLTDKAIDSLKKSETRLNKKDGTGYNHLISLYAALGKKTEVLRLWNLEKSTCERPINKDYINIMASLVKLDEFEEVEKVLKEWEASGNFYDVRVPNTLIIGYSGKGLYEKAKALLENLTEKGKVTLPNIWGKVAAGFFDKNEVAKAFSCMKAALCLYEENKEWKPNQKVISGILSWLGDEGSAEDLEAFVSALKNVIPMNREMYHAVLKAHIRAGKEVHGLLDDMKTYKIKEDEETKKILSMMQK